MAHYRRPPPGRLRPGVLDNKTQTKQTRKTSPPQGACKFPKKGPERKNNKGKSDKTEQNPIEAQATVPMSFPPKKGRRSLAVTMPPDVNPNPQEGPE